MYRSVRMPFVAVEPLDGKALQLTSAVAEAPAIRRTRHSSELRKMARAIVESSGGAHGDHGSFES